ncbi:hypothetical protein KG091_06895 [Carnobacteriaceae bacterium zg-ZUI78]|uniref:DUF6612 family protein n=1 Tax=Granulicatella sp. zg-84 TaxID=2678503 RepID=UPI0013C063CE|nr:DUF6612 family protein [Granulicatella sp. zg-84]MBS4750802.1 hypothetical protein [Carnobacteriaceae bacterium zg-ZUI78]NEW66520.1 hypothetical protein [Granulicatella sp. zg-84]QMI85492.1 hypothetical protein H1220_07170 [Carnobacteriaceae bacterium zg-84]
MKKRIMLVGTLMLLGACNQQPPKPMTAVEVIEKQEAAAKEIKSMSMGMDMSIDIKQSEMTLPTIKTHLNLDVIENPPAMKLDMGGVNQIINGQVYYVDNTLYTNVSGTWVKKEGTMDEFEEMKKSAQRTNTIPAGIKEKFEVKETMDNYVLTLQLKDKEDFDNLINSIPTSAEAIENFKQAGATFESGEVTYEVDKKSFYIEKMDMILSMVTEDTTAQKISVKITIHADLKGINNVNKIEVPQEAKNAKES